MQSYSHIFAPKDLLCCHVNGLLMVTTSFLAFWRQNEPKRARDAIFEKHARWSPTSDKRFRTKTISRLAIHACKNSFWRQTEWPQITRLKRISTFGAKTCNAQFLAPKSIECCYNAILTPKSVVEFMNVLCVSLRAQRVVARVGGKTRGTASRNDHGSIWR